MQQPPWLAALSIFPDSHLRHIRNLQNQVRQEKTPAEITEIREDQPQRCTQACNPGINGDRWGSNPGYKTDRDCHIPRSFTRKPCRLRGQGATENEERIAMVMEYIHFIMPRIADKETVNHICGEVNNWMRLHSYKPKPIKGRLTKDISNIPPAISCGISPSVSCTRNTIRGQPCPLHQHPFPRSLPIRT